MNFERAALKGKLAEAEQRFKRLTESAEDKCDSTRRILDRAFNPVLEMEIAKAEIIMDELCVTYAELLGLRTEIERLKKRLE